MNRLNIEIFTVFLSVICRLGLTGAHVKGAHVDKKSDESTCWFFIYVAFYGVVLEPFENVSFTYASIGEWGR